jgi:histidinol-phosphate aminotransferase
VLPWVTRYPHLVVARSTGKAWGLAGLRLGFAAASPEVAIMLHKVRPMYEINTIAASLFGRMLDHEEAMRASVARVQDGKAHFLASMAELGFCTFAGHGNFLHVAFGEAGESIHRALADMVLYRKAFAEPCLAGFSRFSAAPRAMMAPVADRIRAAIGTRS